MDVVGLFSGVGGIELGFEQAGFNIIWSNEMDEKASTTFMRNHTSKLVVGDISKIDSKDIPKSDVVVGGFPCQAFSIAGYRKGFEDDRGNLFFQLARIIKEKKPRAVFIENVKNLVSHDDGNTFRVITNTLKDYNYKYLRTFVLNAAYYANVPQNRERIYIIGFRNKKDYIKFEDIQPIELTNSIKNIVNFDLRVDERYYYTPEKCNFYNLLEKNITKRDTVYQWRRIYVRENKSNLCPTLTANMGTGGHNVPIVLTKYGIRKLTPSECFEFQGYPPTFKLPTELAVSHLYKQAGNSVVVPVIKRLALNLKKALED